MTLIECFYLMDSLSIDQEIETDPVVEVKRGKE